MANLSGQSIKGYELLERIGAGGYGAVYRAYQSTVGREVAVKMILPGYANREEFIRRFEVEAQLVARLEHLHIVPLYDYWRDPEGAYLVMRWLRGGSLQRALLEGPFELRPAALLIDQVAAGLAAAHHQGVIHCDLKPSNVLLDEEGNAYLADFSIARILRDREARPPKGSPVDRLQTDISPEQARGEPATPQTDIYSLGVLLYQVLTGEHPFPGTLDVERFYKHLNDPLPVIETLNEAVCEAVNDVIRKATAKNPAHRFRDALEMAAAFRLAAQLDGDLAVAAEALTPREEEVLQRIVEGCSNKEIAQDLVIELTTVKWYITQIYRKLGVRSRRQAIARAQEANVLAADDGGSPEDTAVSIAMPEPMNPYKGLRAFDISDARDFFGREEAIERLIAQLAPTAAFSLPLSEGPNPSAGRFLAIVGPSGSGKSSLVKAGLIPALRQGAVAGSDRWFTVQLVPGKRPIDQLEIALTRVAADQSHNLRRHLERDAYGLLRAADLILPQNDSELLVIIDQFEEVFTLVEEEARRSHFLALLSTAVSESRSRVRVILTLRADYYARPLHYPDFAHLLREHMETILPLTLEGLERAVRRPADRIGVRFEPGLVDAIVDDVQYQPGALPLLQYALTELFEGRENGVLTHAAYRDLGGTTGALARRAEQLYDEQEDEGREAIRQMFLRLVAVEDNPISAPDARQRVPRSELTSLVEDEESMDELIDAYAAYRLLTLDHDPDQRRPTVEVAHEALLREWRRLRGWLDECREDLRLGRQLARAVEEWRRAGEDASYALRGARLEQFEAWSVTTRLALTAGERKFLEAGRALREEQAAAESARQAREANLERRARRVLAALAVISLFAAVVSSLFAFAAVRQRAETERNFAQSESQRLAAEAVNILERGASFELAALLALRALGAHYTPQADLALQRAVSGYVDSSLIQAPGGAFFPLVSADNRFVRFMRDDPDGSAIQIVELWDLQTVERLWQVQGYVMLGYPWTVRDFTADGSGIPALTASDSRLVLLDAGTGEPYLEFAGNESNFIHPQLSADGRILAASTEDGSVHIWDALTAEELRRFSVGGGGFTRFEARRDLLVAVSPDSRLVAARGGGLTHIWDLATGEKRYVFEHDHSGLIPPQFMDEGRLLVAAVAPVLSIWDLNTGKEVRHAVPPGGEGILSRDGRLYAQGWSGESNNEIVLWEIASGKALHRLDDHTGSAWPVGFTSDLRRLVTAGSDGTARMWDVVSGREQLIFAGHTGPILAAVISAGDRYLVTAGADDAVRIWDLGSTAETTGRLEGVGDSLRLSPDGRTLLTSDPGTGLAVLLDAQTLALRHRLDFALADGNGGLAPGFPFSSDGGFVLGVKDYSTILVYDARSGERIAEHANPDGVYAFASFVPGISRIFAGGDRGAYLLDAESGRQLQIFAAPDTYVNAAGSGLVGVSPDGRYGALHMWTRDSLNVVYLWNLETGDLVFRSTPKPNDVATDFDFSADGRYFAWSGSEGNAYVLDLQDFRQVREFAHLDVVLGVDFSAGSGLLLTSSLGEDVTIWDLESGESVRRFYTGAGPTGFAEFVDGDAFVLYTTFTDGVIHRQPVGIQGLIEAMCARMQRDLTAIERQTYTLDETPTCSKFAAP